MSPVVIVLGVAGLLLLAVLVLYNRLVRLRNRTQSSWADLDVQLQRRHALLPNLVETVQGYARHERETLAAVTAARTAAVRADAEGRPGRLAAAEERLDGAVGELVAVAEAYPELRADERFRALHDELVATENKIAFSRQLYNDTVTAYRVAIEGLPGRLLAGPLGFEAPELFAAGATERQAVAVELGGEGEESAGSG